MRRTTFISSVTCILIGVWYLVAIVGLDVHFDHHDGEVFVVSLLRGTDCENLHPDDECHCIDHHHGLCHDDDEDCEDNINILSITGDGFHFACNFIPEMSLLSVAEISACTDSVSGHPCPSDGFYAPPRAYLDILCVMRV